MNDYSDLFSQHETDPLLRELNGNVLWRYEPMNPHDQRPPMSSTAPFQAAERIKALEAEVLRIGDVLDNVPSVFLEWPHTDKAPPEFAERLLKAWGKIAIETLRNSEYHKLLRAKYAPTENGDE
jgi:hypothetical protein